MSSLVWKVSSPALALRGEGGFHSADRCYNITSGISSLTLDSPVGISPEIAAAEVTVGVVVMGNDVLGSAGPPHPVCRCSMSFSFSFSSGDGVFGVGVVVPWVPADSAVRLRGRIPGWIRLLMGPERGKRIRSTFRSPITFCHWNLSPIVGSSLNLCLSPETLVWASMRPWNSGQAQSGKALPLGKAAAKANRRRGMVVWAGANPGTVVIQLRMPVVSMADVSETEAMSAGDLDHFEGRERFNSDHLHPRAVGG